MSSYRDFVLTTLKQMAGNIPNYQIRQYAQSYYDKGVLNDADLSEIDALTNPLPADQPSADELRKALDTLMPGGDVN